jgi:hypothetical protein
MRWCSGPAVFAPQDGKALTTSYLSAALRVLGPTLRYVSQWHDHVSAVLDFEADLDGVYVEGMDILRWNDHVKLVSFTIMVRPLRGLQKLASTTAAHSSADKAMAQAVGDIHGERRHKSQTEEQPLLEETAVC